MRGFFHQMLRWADWLLKRLAPVSARRITYLSIPDFGDSAWYQYRHLLRTRQQLEHVWLVADLAVEARIRGEFAAMAGAPAGGHQLRVVRKASLQGYWLYLTSRWVFYTHGLYAFAGAGPGRTVVCLWHGMPIKCIGALDQAHPSSYRPHGDIHVASSHLFRYVVASAFEVDAGTVRITGLPRCDALDLPEARGHTRAQVRAALGLAQRERLVLWLPTFRTRLRDGSGIQPQSFIDDLPSGTAAALQQQADAHGCRILVKLHPQDRLNREPATMPQSAITMLSSADWLRHGIQLYDLLAAADGLISDVSSVIVDYLVTGRPLGILGFDPGTYNRDLTIPMQQLLNSERISDLRLPSEMAAFFSAAAADKGQTLSPGDCAALLDEQQPMPRAERVALEAGL